VGKGIEKSNKERKKIELKMFCDRGLGEEKKMFFRMNKVKCIKLGRGSRGFGFLIEGKKFRVDLRQYR